MIKTTGWPHFWLFCNLQSAQFCFVFLEQVTWLVVTQFQSESYRLVTECRHDTGVLCAVTHIFAYWTSTVSVTRIIFFISECGIAHFLRVKFRFCRALHCWASPRRKTAYSITQSLSHYSLTQLIWCAGNLSFRFGTYIGFPNCKYGH